VKIEIWICIFEKQNIYIYIYIHLSYAWAGKHNIYLTTCCRNLLYLISFQLLHICLVYFPHDVVMVWHLRVKHLGTFTKEHYCVWYNCLSFSKYDLCDLLFPQSMVDNLVCCTGWRVELEFDLSSSPVLVNIYYMLSMACTYARLSLNDSHLTLIFLLYNFSHYWAGDQEGGNERVRENESNAYEQQAPRPD